VRGRVDWLRRLDHIQQHTGQHILSQAFVSLFKAPTHSFRVLEQSCEIDVELQNPTGERIERAVELANNVIWEDRTISITEVTPQQAAELPLRKDSAREGELRLIEIEGFDLTPCGGTHAYRTGEVGIIAVRSWERAKGLTRIEFVAGGRALADYRRANHSARTVAALFSGGRDDGPLLAEKLLDENKELQRRVRMLEEITTRVEAEELLAGLDVAGELAAASGASELTAISGAGENEPRIVANIFDNRDAESLRRLAHSLIAHPRTIALLGSRDDQAARLVFARSADVSGDMNMLMRDACALLEGRGGGKPDLAQGGGKNVGKLEDAIAAALATLTQRR
jgi:alanyl-tRNA synthetase